MKIKGNNYPWPHNETVTRITITDQEADFLNRLHAMKIETNSMGHPHDSGFGGGTYKSLDEAFRITLRNAITNGQICYYTDADIAVQMIVDLLLDSGESFLYCLDYFNRGGPLGGWNTDDEYSVSGL